MIAAARSQLTTLYSLPRLGAECAHACVITSSGERPARHSLSNTHDVMASRAGIAKRTIVVVGARSAEVQFGELGTIRIPLEHHHLRPVVPDRRGQNRILVDPDVAHTARAARDR